MKSLINSNWHKLAGRVQAGYGVASGAGDTPYEAGTILLQTPYFLQHGLDLRPYFAATLNISIAPYTWQFTTPSYHVENLYWTAKHPPETFSFGPCELEFKQQHYHGLVYFPHPETKQTHYQSAHTIELLMPHIAHISYNSSVVLYLPTQYFCINKNPLNQL